jgi:hypothetical protein
MAYTWLIMLYKTTKNKKVFYTKLIGKHSNNYLDENNLLNSAIYNIIRCNVHNNLYILKLNIGLFIAVLNEKN